ncbi:MAG TPA: hypothetical protein VGK00_09335 [Anaerolineales bacterium]|jgi:hypothetical protein
MKPKMLLTIAAIYMALLGVLLVASPGMAFGLAPDAPASLIAKLRLPGSLFLAFAVMNWFARNTDASSARDAIFIGNTLVFAFVAIVDFLIIIIPGANPSGWLFVVVDLLFVIAFFVVGRVNMATVTK